MSEINPRTDTSVVNTDIGMRLYSFFTNFEMFSYFRSLNCFDFRRLDSWQTVSSKTRMFLLSYSTISGRSDESKIASIGSNEFRSVSKIIIIMIIIIIIIIMNFYSPVSNTNSLT